MDDEVITRLVEDAIDSESREVLTMSRSRLVQRDAFSQSEAKSSLVVTNFPSLGTSCIFLHALKGSMFLLQAPIS